MKCRIKLNSFQICIRWILPIVALIFIACCRYFPHWAEAYARTVYPLLSGVLSAFSSLFPFSLEEILVVGLLLWLFIFPIRKRRKGWNWKRIAVRELEVLVWIYIWFYMGWGLNYFRYNIYTRLQVKPVSYNEQVFVDFLHSYTDSLNIAYTQRIDMDAELLESEVKSFYSRTSKEGGLSTPKDWQQPKYFMFTPIYSSVGVLGSMGPFFAEAQLNADLLPVQIPFTYAHEFSHLLGVSNEAEANYWAYRACTESHDEVLKYSGYLGLLPYVVSNASRLLSKEQFQEWVKTIRPEVITDYKKEQTHWQEKYSSVVGAIQDYLYNLFLKGNNIPSGKKNYAEVIGILLALDAKS